MGRTTRRTTTTTTTARPTTPPTTARTYIRPNVKSLGSQFSTLSHDYYSEEEEEVSAANPWYVYECIPLLKNLAGFDEGTKRNSILTQFIKHMNKNALKTVKTFVDDKKTCNSDYSGQEAGHLVESEGR